MRRRGATIVEMTLATSLAGLVIGVMAALYGFTMVRLSHATANFSTTNDAVLAANAIVATVRDATACTVVNSGPNPGLKCVMPASGHDRDADGRLDSFQITRVSRRGYERVTPGKRVWYYRSNSTGAFGQSGTILFRAERSDDQQPTGSDVDWSFAYATGTRVRYPSISGLSFSVDASAQTVTATVTASALTRAERHASGSGESAQSYTHTETRTAFWRNWRP